MYAVSALSHFFRAFFGPEKGKLAPLPCRPVCSSEFKYLCV